MATAGWRCEPRLHGRNKPASPLRGRRPSIVAMPHRSALVVGNSTQYFSPDKIKGKFKYEAAAPKKGLAFVPLKLLEYTTRPNQQDDGNPTAPSTVRPWARGFCPHGRPGPLGFGLCGRLPRHGVGGFMFNSSSSRRWSHARRLIVPRGPEIKTPDAGCRTPRIRSPQSPVRPKQRTAPRRAVRLGLEGEEWRPAMRGDRPTTPCPTEHST